MSCSIAILLHASIDDLSELTAFERQKLIAGLEEEMRRTVASVGRVNRIHPLKHWNIDEKASELRSADSRAG